MLNMCFGSKSDCVHLSYNNSWGNTIYWTFIDLLQDCTSKIMLTFKMTLFQTSGHTRPSRSWSSLTHMFRDLMKTGWLGREGTVVFCGWWCWSEGVRASQWQISGESKELPWSWTQITTWISSACPARCCPLTNALIHSFITDFKWC